MKTRVLIVDDSLFFRNRLKEILETSDKIEIIGTASDGKDAVEKAIRLKPDVITMDIIMPEMDGIAAVRNILSRLKVKIIMFSSMTTEGAKATLDALDAGAADFLPKKFSEISNNDAEIHNTLISRVLALGGKQELTRNISKPLATPPPSVTISNNLNKKISLIVIGASTGGPMALHKIMPTIPANFAIPILIIQHMPESFTKDFAHRLNATSRISVSEASQNDLFRKGTALVAPGGHQLLIGNRNNKQYAHIAAGKKELPFNPCIDVTFASAANNFPGQVLGIVLTGMGTDGRKGAGILKQSKSTVWAQDEATSSIYGMPMAVAKAGLADRILPLEEIGPLIAGIKL